jgi:RHS repeat-associated protein
MHYDPLGMPAMLTHGDSCGQQIVMDGWRPLLFANRFGSLTGLVIWVGSLPVAWIQAGRVHHLVVDWRGAPTHAFTPEGRIVWRASYLEPLLPRVEAQTLRRNSDGRSLRRKTTHEQVQIPLGVAGRWMADPKLVHEDPRLAPLLFGAFRVLDGTQSRFLQPDPLGPAGDRDPYAYAEARPWQYVDPWGLARLTYFAILQSERHSSGVTQRVGTGGGVATVAPRTQQGFAIGRWSFLLESIAPASRAPEASSGTLSALQNNYAKHRQSLLFDAQGSFRLSLQDPLVGTWFGTDTLRFDASDGQEVMSSFRAHYGASLITRSAFVLDDFDDQQATRLMALLSRDRAARTQCMSPSNLWLPPLLLGERATPIQPDAPQGEGNTVQRMLRCDGALAGIPEPILQSLYADPLEGSRVERLQAAAQLQEAPAPSSITPVCTGDGCRTRTAIEVNGRKYYASYGSTQFVMESFLRTLRKNVLSASGLDPRTLGWLGLDQTIADAQGRSIPLRLWVDQGIARAGAAARAFDDIRSRFGKGLSESEASRRWQTMTSAQQQQWMLSTGLDSRAFVDMLGFVPDGRARTEAEARNAFAAEAVLRLGQDQAARGRFGEWLLGLFSDSARFGFVSRLFLRNHLRKVLSEPRLQGLLAGAGTASPVAGPAAQSATTAASSAGAAARGSRTHISSASISPPGSATVSTGAPLASSRSDSRSLQVEAEIAYRVALMHNGGEGAPGALDPSGIPPPYLRQYAEEFMRRSGRGNWEALRCLDHLGVAGLQMQTLRLA